MLAHGFHFLTNSSHIHVDAQEKRKRLGMDGELEDDEEGGGGEGKEGVDITGPSTMDDEEEEEDADDVGGLLVGLDDEQVGRSIV